MKRLPEDGASGVALPRVTLEDAAGAAPGRRSAVDSRSSAAQAEPLHPAAQGVGMQAQNSRLALPRIVETISGNGTRLVNMNIVKPSLEDVFIHLTGKALRD